MPPLFPVDPIHPNRSVIDAKLSCDTAADRRFYRFFFFFALGATSSDGSSVRKGAFRMVGGDRSAGLAPSQAR
jgi:hypothetical protein